MPRPVHRPSAISPLERARRVLFWALMMMAACSGPGRSAPLVEASSSARVAPGPTYSNGAPCDPVRDPRLPAGIGCVTSVASGDRRLFVYASIDDAGNPKSWHLRLIEGDRQEDRALPGGTVASYPRAVAVTDVDDDGSPDWWVKVRDYASHGAPWGGLFLYVERGGTIAPLRYQGAPLVIDFGGITRLGEGAACRDGDLVLLRAEAKDRRNLRWATSERRFAIEGRSARLVDRTQSTLVIEDYNDPDLDPYYEVTCDGVSFSVFAPPPD